MYKAMKKIILVIQLLLLTDISTNAQDSRILDAYIQEGLENNLTLQRKHYSFQQSIHALYEAKSMFMPQIMLNARYSLANGGRVIDFPVGDMLNPVYNSLNQLMEQKGMEKPFREIDNIQMNFIRAREHETKLSLIQPLINHGVSYQYRIAEEQTAISQAQLDIYKKELIKEIKIGYFNYLKSVKILDLVDETRLVLKENLRVTTKLYERGLITEDKVMRSRSELRKLDVNEAVAVKNFEMAKAYFNFLLNRDKSDSVILDSGYDMIHAGDTFPSDYYYQSALDNREEIYQLSRQYQANEYAINLAGSQFFPNISIAIDYGFQGLDYNFSSESDFLMGSLVLQWNLFSGFSKINRKQRSMINRDIIRNQKQELESNLELEVKEAYHTMKQNKKAYEAAFAELTEAEKTYKITYKLYLQGKASLIELIDSRTNMTDASVMKIVAQYDILIAMAEIERISGPLMSP